MIDPPRVLPWADMFFHRWFKAVRMKPKVRKENGVKALWGRKSFSQYSLSGVRIQHPVAPPVELIDGSLRQPFPPSVRFKKGFYNLP
jgi:hypothetical protein